MSHPRRLLPGVALIAMVAVVNACGSTAPAGVADRTTAAVSKAVQFAGCMRSHGVSQFPDPGPSGRLTIDQVANGSSLDTSSAAFGRALSACRRMAPAGFMGNERSPQQQEAALKFAQCMRRSGVPDFPDPTPNGPLIDTDRVPSAVGRGARSIPGFDAASHRCMALYSVELGLRGQ